MVISHIVDGLLRWSQLREESNTNRGFGSRHSIARPIVGVGEDDCWYRRKGSESM